MVQVKFYCVACSKTKYRSDKNVYYITENNNQNNTFLNSNVILIALLSANDIAEKNISSLIDKPKIPATKPISLH